MLRSKYFWIAIVVLVPFIVIWIMEGLVWAIITLITVSVLCIYILGRTRRKQSEDIHIIIEDDERPVRRQPRRSAIQTGLDWHVPKVDKDGVEFITGARGMRRSQEDAMRRAKKRLWG